ncbi:MAG: hypothetical protein GY790_14090 [Bacteroidetes bacterium]|nr:hypothetical protein [Bacteroidota bacterium]
MKIIPNTGLLFLLLILLPVEGLSGGSQAEEIPKLQNPFSESYVRENLRKTKPRLIFSAEIVENVRGKVESDPVLANFYKAIRLNAFEILDQPLLERVQTGRRILGISRTMLQRINLLGVVYLLEEDPVILERINREVLAVCKFSDWNPSHYLDVAEMSMALALALDWTGDRLPESTIDLVKRSLIEKGIHPSWPEYEGEEQWWVSHPNNWNQVCHGGMIAASIAIAEDEPELAAKTIKRALDGLPSALSQYLPDGVYPEGPGYWSYGTSFSVLSAAMLESAFGTDFGHDTYPGFMESAMFKVMCTSPSGLYFNYADCGDRSSPQGDVVLAWFAAKTGNPLFYESDGFLGSPAEMELDKLSGAALAWMSQYEGGVYEQAPLQWFGMGVNPIAIFRDAEGRSPYYFATKGGCGAQSHGNMDAGSFVFELDRVRWVIDPGVQSYYELEKTGFDLWGQCQECERWKLLTKNNFGHSTLTVNDRLHTVDGAAVITDFKRGDRPEVSIDLTPAFMGELSHAQRHFVRDGDRSLLIEDVIELNHETKSLTWQLITVADVEIVENGAILRQDGKELQLNNLSHGKFKLNVVSLDPPPMELDKKIKGLKRIELRIPVSMKDKDRGSMKIRLRLESQMLK